MQLNNLYFWAENWDTGAKCTNTTTNVYKFAGSLIIVILQELTYFPSVLHERWKEYDFTISVFLSQTIREYIFPSIKSDNSIFATHPHEHKRNLYESFSLLTQVVCFEIED